MSTTVGWTHNLWFVPRKECYAACAKCGNEGTVAMHNTDEFHKRTV